MTEKSRQPIGKQFCPHYNTDVTLWLTVDQGGRRTLVAHYAQYKESTIPPFKSTDGQTHPADGSNYLPRLHIAPDGSAEFGAGIPAKWTDQDVLRFVAAAADQRYRYPLWEMPARALGSPELSWPEDWEKK